MLIIPNPSSGRSWWDVIGDILGFPKFPKLPKPPKKEYPMPRFPDDVVDYNRDSDD